MTNHNDEVAATATTQDALDVLIERLNYWRSKAIAEAGEVEAMEQAYTELQQRLDYTQKSRDMFMGSAKAWRATAERNASACAHWQSVALERKAERDELRLDLAGASESIDRVASRVIELDTQYNRAMLDLARCQAMAQIGTNHKTADVCKALRQRCAAIASERDALKTDNTEMARHIEELAVERNELRFAGWAATRRVTELERENGELQQRLIEHERRLCVACGSREGDECDTKECCTFDATPNEAANYWGRKHHEIREERDTFAKHNEELLAEVERLRDERKALRLKVDRLSDGVHALKYGMETDQQDREMQQQEYDSLYREFQKLLNERDTLKVANAELYANAERLHEAANANAAKAQRFYEMFRNEQKANRARLRELIKRKRGQAVAMKQQLAKAQREIEALKVTNEQLWEAQRHIEYVYLNGSQIKQTDGHHFFADHLGNKYVSMPQYHRVLDNVERKVEELELMEQRIDALRRANETLVAALRNSDSERNAIKRERDIALQQLSERTTQQQLEDDSIFALVEVRHAIDMLLQRVATAPKEPSNE